MQQKWIKYAFSAAVVFGGFTYAVTPDRPLRAITQVYPPFQVLGEDGAVRGTAVQMFQCAMNLAGRSYTLEMVTGDKWEDAQERVKRGEADAFFGGLWTAPRAEYAAWSAPIEVSQAYYIRLREPEFDRRDPDMRWGVKQGSGVQQTVKGLPIHVTYLSQDNPDLVLALMRRNIDWLYMDLAIFKWAVSQNSRRDWELEAITDMPDRPFDTELFHLEPAKEQVYGVWVSRKWMANHPDFLEGGPSGMGLNDAIGACRQKREISVSFPFLRLVRLRRRAWESPA